MSEGQSAKERADADPGRTREPITARERWRAVLRIVLGTAQIMSATMTLVFLMQTGLSPWTMGACVVTGLFMITSRLLFWTRENVNILKKVAAELFGTFSLVFAGTGAIIINEVSGGTVSHVGVALTFGLIVLAMIYSLGDVSGAHLNPAVTLGFWAARRFPTGQVLPYVLSQCVGALLASAALRLLFSQNRTLGATLPAGSDTQSFFLELVMACLLMFVVLSVSTGAKEKGITAGIAVGAVIALEALFGGPISGASMNPARSLGPALVTIRLEKLWIYLTAPPLGAWLAVLACRCVREQGCCTRVPEETCL